MIKEFFQKPYGVGTALNIHMFHPQRLAHAAGVLASDRRYFTARLRTIFYQLIHPDRPWLTQQANAFLMAYLKPDMAGFEWGSGKSTIWDTMSRRSPASASWPPTTACGAPISLSGRRPRLLLRPARCMRNGAASHFPQEGGRRSERSA